MFNDMSGSHIDKQVLALSGVSVTYPGGVTALKHTDLAIKRGELTVLLGPSGAGKSTLLRSMNLLIRPTSGQVRIPTGEDLATQRALRHHRKQTAMIFQHHQLILRHTALRNVLIGRLGYHGFWRSVMPLSREDERIALAALEHVGLLDKALTRTDNLSGGMQQRVGIARALAQQPTLILADEPVASLDPASAQSIMRLLKKVCHENGITLVASLHQVDLALEHADRIVGLAHGSVIFDAATRDVTQADISTIYANQPAAAHETTSQLTGSQAS